MPSDERNAPLISVVLPTLNRAALLPRSIGSVLGQSFRNFELIVVDDGSTEDIRSVVNSFNDPRLVYVRREQPGGVAVARNAGVRQARGELLAFQDSDDEWLLDKLEHQLSVLSGSRECGVSVCGLLRISPRGSRRYPKESADGVRKLTYCQILEWPFAYTQTWLVRRNLLLDVGGFDERMRVWDDWELLIRLSEKTSISFTSEPLIVSYQGPDSISREVRRFVHDMEIVLDKHRHALSSHKRQFSQLEYVYARLCAGTGDLTKSRKALLRAIRLNPSRIKPWAFLAATLLGSGAVSKLLGIVPDTSA